MSLLTGAPGVNTARPGLLFLTACAYMLLPSFACTRSLSLPPCPRRSFSTLNAPEEVELAEVLLGLHPWAKGGQVRFARGGGEIDMMAVRIARAYTGRDRVAICGYHGWTDVSAPLPDPALLWNTVLHCAACALYCPQHQFSMRPIGCCLGVHRPSLSRPAHTCTRTGVATTRDIRDLFASSVWMDK